MINNVIRGKRIGELSFSDMKQNIEKSGEPAVIIKSRLEYLEHAMSLKLPGKPDEAWRRTNLRELDLKNYSISEPLIEIENACDRKQDRANLYIKTISDTMENNPELFDRFYESWNQIQLIAEKNKDTVYTSDMEKTVFMSLSESLFNSGIFIYAPKFTELKKPIKIKITPSDKDSVILPKVFIFMEEGSRVDLVIESCSKGGEGLLSLGMVNGIVKEGAKLNIVSYQNFNENSTSFHNKIFAICKDASLSYDFIQTGSKLSMTQHKHLLVGTGAEIQMNGVVRASEDQFVGNRLDIHHYSPKTFSNFKSKSVLRDKSKVVFLGNIKMPEIAQKCSGHQSADNLILGDESKAEVIPRLEIIADDVSCSHGATVGSIDKEKLFYLTSRGIGEDEAEDMIIKAYYQDMLNNMSVLKKHRCVYDYITEKLTKKLKLEFDAFSPCCEQ